MLFSSNCFNLDTNFFVNQPFLFFGERLLGPREFSSGKLALSAFWKQGFSSLDLAFCKLHLFLQTMLITATTAVTLPVFVVSIAISSALTLSLGAVEATFIGWGSVDKWTVPKGLSILRCLSKLNQCCRTLL